MRVLLFCITLLNTSIGLCQPKSLPIHQSTPATTPNPVNTESLKIKGVEFKVEVAKTPDALKKGLMFRKSLPQNGGMLFIFPEPRRLSFWMKDTLISLDIIFINQYGKIVWIYPRTKPHSERVIRCPFNAKAALEVVAGTAERLMLMKGDLVEHALFKVNE